ncbi:MAG TPA: CDP-alcohol phosphatidyltransferase family protein [Candidatus Limnocylindria bacterium]|nr:CDP-alcohol phosphatidyltransferase family protein [Candidatus Limnocylindria bacterium]
MSASHSRAHDLTRGGSLVPAWVKQASRAVLNPIVRGALAIGLTANAITVLGLLVTVAAAVVIGSGALLAGAAILLAGSALDAVDGAIARANGGGTAFGSFLDSTLDRASEAILYLGVAAFLLRFVTDPMLPVLGVMAALAGSFLVSYAHARAQGIGLEASVGLAPRTERLVIIIAGIALAGLGWLPGLLGAIGLVAILTVVTAIQRIWHVYRSTAAAATAHANDITEHGDQRG